MYKLYIEINMRFTRVSSEYCNTIFSTSVHAKVGTWNCCSKLQFIFGSPTIHTVSSRCRYQKHAFSAKYLSSNDKYSFVSLTNFLENSCAVSSRSYLIHPYFDTVSFRFNLQQLLFRTGSTRVHLWQFKFHTDSSLCRKFLSRALLD